MIPARLYSALRYTLLSLRAHALRCLLTAAAIAVVSGVLCYLLSLTDSLHAALRHEADPRNLLVLAEGATAESNSEIPFEQYQLVKGVPGIATDARGAPLISAEVVAGVRLPRRTGGAFANIALRGVDLETALRTYERVRLRSGRWFAPGADEIVVGAAAQRRMANTELDAEIQVGSRRFRVVGVLEAAGGAHESELWGVRANVASALHRGGISSLRVRMNSTDPTDVAEIRQHIAGAGIGLRSFLETEYFAGATASGRLLEALAGALALIMAAGAVFVALNTMYAAVAGRAREIGILRAIGYRPRSILGHFLLEALLISGLGGVLGCALCGAWLLFDSGLRDLVGRNQFVSVAFALHTSPRAVGVAIGAALLIGLVGGLGPAWSASRIAVVRALRAA